MDDFMDDAWSGGQGSASDSMSAGYDKAIGTYEDYLNKISDMYAPYMASGKFAGGKMQNQGGMENREFRSMMGGPGQSWQEAYTESPSAQYQTQIGTDAANASAAASGMLGSGVNQRAVDTMSQDIAAKDRDQYYQEMMGLGAAANKNFSQLQSSGAGFAQDLGKYTYDTGGEIGQAQIGQGMADAYGDMANSSMWHGAVNSGIGAAIGGMG